MKKKALLCGLNYPGTTFPLQGCVNDVNLMADVLTEQFGFEAANRRMLTNEAATTDAMLERLEWLVADNEPGDVLYFHYSGHGSQMVNQTYEADYEPDGKDEILCVSGDSLISTNMGLMPAKAVYDQVASNKKISAKVGDEFFNITDAPTLLKKSYIKVTNDKGMTTSFGHDHPVFVNDNGSIKCKDAKDLTIDDYIVQSFGIWKEKYEIDKLWYLVGLFLGDGFFSSNKSIRFCVNSYKDFWLGIEDMAQSMGADTRHYYDSRGSLVIRITYSPLVELLKELGYKVNASKRTRDFDKFNMPMEPSKAKALIRGLFDADGSSATSTVNFITEDKQIADIVHILLNSFGIRNSIVGDKYSIINIHSLSANDFISKVGFGIKEKNEKVKQHENTTSGHKGEFGISSIIAFASRWNIKKKDISVGLGVHPHTHDRIKTKLVTKAQHNDLIGWVDNKINVLKDILSKDDISVEERRSIGASMNNVSTIVDKNQFTVNNSFRRGIFDDVKLYAQQMLAEAEYLFEVTSGFDYEYFTLARVKNIEVVHEQIQMYDFTVEDAHKFECNGLLVHNCPHDLNWRDKVIRDDDLKRIFDKVPNGVALTVVLDCCNSGTGLDQETEYQPFGLGAARTAERSAGERWLPMPDDIANRARGLGLETNPRSVQSRDVNNTGMLITGCQSHQTSADAWIGDRFYGAATYYLAASLSKNGWDATHMTMITDMNNSMVKYGYSQRPQLDGAASLYETKFAEPIYVGTGLEEPTTAEPVVEDVVVEQSVVEEKESNKWVYVLLAVATAIVAFTLLA